MPEPSDYGGCGQQAIDGTDVPQAIGNAGSRCHRDIRVQVAVHETVGRCVFVKRIPKPLREEEVVPLADPLADLRLE